MSRKTNHSRDGVRALDGSRARVLRLSTTAVLPRRSRAGRHARRDEWQAGDRRYLSDGSMALLYPDSDTGSIAAIDSGE
jgi:hypothetical protein